MNKDILLIVDSMSNERGVSKEIIFQAIEAALASVAERRYAEKVTIRVAINRETGDYETFRYWTVVKGDEEELEISPSCHILLSKAVETDPELDVGDVIEEQLESPEFGRIAAQQAKQ